MQIPMIAISGGPCAGKSSFLSEAAQWLEGYGIVAIVVPEAATVLIKAGITPWGLGLEAFQRRVLRATTARERRYKALIRRRGLTRAVLFVDRGRPDCEAYCGQDMFSRLIAERGTSRAEVMLEYLMVIHLVTAADGAEAFYTLENNETRTETLEEARALDKRSRHAWRGHPHIAVIDNSTDFATKIQRAIRALARKLHMPEPKEIERSWIIRNFTPKFIPDDATKIQIIQTYLTRPEVGERRLRMRTVDGVTGYYYTEKIPTTTMGERIERERVITATEYRELLREADPTRNPIEKTRYVFLYAGNQFEIDVYTSEPHRSAGLVKLEVELHDINDEVIIPAAWDVIEVTDDPKYLNSNLAAA